MHKKWQPAEKLPPVELPSSVAKRKNLHLIKRQTEEKLTKEVVLDGVLHELQNCLQSIGMGVDLLQLSQPEALECQTIMLGIERASRLLREVQEYFFPPELYLSTRSVKDVLTETMHGVVKAGEDEHIQLQHPETPLSFQYDWFTLGRVLERIFRCACGILSPEGGKVIARSGARDGQVRTLVEIKVEIYGARELDIDESKIFTPFWRVNNYQAGLGLVLAQQALHSRHGQLTFEKISPCSAHFTLLLEVPPDAIVSGRAGKEEGHGCVE
jgi:nitrogen-specific signal transduction histidine kinase